MFRKSKIVSIVSLIRMWSKFYLIYFLTLILIYLIAGHLNDVVKVLINIFLKPNPNLFNFNKDH